MEKESKQRFRLTKLERAWILYDVGNSAFVLMVATLIPIFFNALAAAGGLSSVEYLAYWGYATSVVTIITAILSPILGTLADTKGFKKPIFILCDDVYRGLCTRPCPDPAALPGLQERLLIAQSFSKPWAMTGWRIGYLMGSAPVIRKLTALHGHILTCAPSMLQAACETALETDTAPMRETYAKRRALVLRRLHAMGLCCPVPEGAFYAFPDIRAFGLRSEEFCLRLIAEAGVAAVPGSCFGTEGHIRISYCCGEQTLERGMDRLEAFLEKLKQERRT